MIEVTDCALVDKAVVQRLREEAKSDRESGYTSRIMRGLTTTAVLRELDLWEDNIKESTKREAENSMERVIKEMRERCCREYCTNCTDAAAVARGILWHIKEHAPETTYTAADVYDLLRAMRAIEFSDPRQQKEIP